jgi:signal transduction histidine kinase
LENEIGTNVWLTHIKDQSARMSMLVHNLLTLAKTEEQNGGRFTAFDISQAILSTALEFESRAFEEKKRLSCHVTPGLRFVGEETKIKQVCAILLDNAVRYSGENARIEVSLKVESEKLILSVYNTGEGIKDTELLKVFERFYRSDESRARETGGYGLGLSIAKSIVESHKGRIIATGKYGEWVQFSVFLPCTFN